MEKFRKLTYKNILNVLCDRLYRKGDLLFPFKMLGDDLYTIFKVTALLLWSFINLIWVLSLYLFLPLWALVVYVILRFT